MKAAKTLEDRLLDVSVYIIVIMFVISIIYPFWTMLVDSFSSARASEQLGIKLIPPEFSLEAYGKVFRQEIVGKAYINTLFRTGIGTVLTVFITFCAAFSLSKRELPFRKSITLVIVLTMFFGGGLIPEYIIVKNLGLINNRWVLVLFFLVSPFALIVTRNFIYSIPDELEESALIDGANEFTILFRLIAPLSKPIIATIALWTAVMHWNEWFRAMIFIRDTDKTVLQLLLRRILLEDQMLAVYDDLMIDEATETTETSVSAATLFVSIGPIILVYPFVQKYFIKGVMVGSIKG